MLVADYLNILSLLESVWDSVDFSIKKTPYIKKNNIIPLFISNIHKFNSFNNTKNFLYLYGLLNQD